MCCWKDVDLLGSNTGMLADSNVSRKMFLYTKHCIQRLLSDSNVLLEEVGILGSIMRGMLADSNVLLEGC